MGLMTTPFFNAHHSPIGAFASLTLGMKGPNGGFGLELAGPACEGIYAGVQDREGGNFRSLPFFGHTETASEDFDVEGLSDIGYQSAMRPFEDSVITRSFGASVDEWKAEDFKFRVFSQVQSIPHPSSPLAKGALCPAIVVQIEVDNRSCLNDRKAFFGYAGSDRASGMRILQAEGLVGVGQGSSIAIASSDPGLTAGLAWQPEAVLAPRLSENLGFMLGSIGMLVGTVPAGKRKTFTFSVGFFRSGTATTGIETRYLYRRWFQNVEEVLRHSLAQAQHTIAECKSFDSKLSEWLSPDRAFMAAHAIRSYYGSTQLLETPVGDPLWVVHEGEYRMMNTFDLTVDQTFFELVMNPWTVRNVLDQFVERYSYESDARFPGRSDLHPGGLAFTHDMGVANNFAPAGRSGYEQAGLTGCFSYMSSEELMNWVLTAGLYVFDTEDWDWAQEQRDVWHKCLASLENRDNPVDIRRNGVMGLDDARCAGGAEITTYDSLDTSLGQARNNVYLAVKGWACYRVLQSVLSRLGDAELSVRANVQADRAASTVLGAKDPDGLLPAVIGEGIEARIIPAIEALVYPYVMGFADDYPQLRQILSRHLDGVLKPGVCLFQDGGWKLSSTSGNSWLSKIYLCQFVSERVLGNRQDVVADKAHRDWLLRDENIFYAWSDQMLEGKAVGSRYYPRGVTSILWLGQGPKTLGDIRTRLGLT